MILHNNLSFAIYFGDSEDCCVKPFYKDSIKSFSDLQKKLNLEKLVFLKQTHSSDGLCINDDIAKTQGTLSIFEKMGDYIITNQRNIGIGVVTADCLPLILYDPVKHISAVIHAGWKGAIDNIAIKAFNLMQEKFDCKITDIFCYLGPCAKVCCYKVSEDFKANLEFTNFSEEVFLKKGEDVFFDLVRFVKLQLLDLGIKCERIKEEYNACTICNHKFYSYRRQGVLAGRQATIIVLK